MASKLMRGVLLRASCRVGSIRAAVPMNGVSQAKKTALEPMMEIGWISPYQYRYADGTVVQTGKSAGGCSQCRSEPWGKSLLKKNEGSCSYCGRQAL